MLVVANLGIEPIERPELTLERGPLCGTPSAEVLAGPAGAEAPEVTPDGGFEAYVPVERLAPREALVVDLADD